MLALVDYDALSLLAQSTLPRPMSVVVLDPPVTGVQVQGMVQLAPAGEVHLAWSGDDIEFATRVQAERANARAALRGTWSQLTAGHTEGERLEHALFDGGSAHLRPPAAVRNALHELVERGLVHIDANGTSLTVVTQPVTSA
jgi:hypothetical protein